MSLIDLCAIPFWWRYSRPNNNCRNEKVDYIIVLRMHTSIYALHPPIHCKTTLLALIWRTCRVYMRTTDSFNAPKRSNRLRMDPPGTYSMKMLQKWHEYIRLGLGIWLSLTQPCAHLRLSSVRSVPRYRTIFLWFNPRIIDISCSSSICDRAQ